jgi:hypothetical protein
VGGVRVRVVDGADVGAFTARMATEVVEGAGSDWVQREPNPSPRGAFLAKERGGEGTRGDQEARRGALRAE